MALLTDYLFVDALVALLTVIAISYFYLKHCNKYWKTRGVPYVKPHLFFGNLKDTFLGRKSLIDVHLELYKDLSGHPFGGYFELTTPNLLIRDPELIERILIKDFSHFMDRTGVVDADLDIENDPLSTGLSNLSGDTWRTMRYKLTPTFTTGKLKGMFEQIYNCGDGLSRELGKYSDRREEIEAKEVLALFTSDVIASCAFGLQFQHDSEEGKKFRDMAEKIFIPSLVQRLKFFVYIFSKHLAKLFGRAMFPTDVTEYFVNITKAIIEQRTKNKTERNDFLQLLMNLREQDKTGKVTDMSAELKGEDAYLKLDNFKPTKDSDKIEFSDGVLAGQAFLFLSAGSDTVSSATSLILYSIATNLSVQRRVQQEVDSALRDYGGWSYKAVKEMVYLDQVVQEGLRIHPLQPGLRRVCTSPYRIPNSDVILQKGDQVTIPVFAVHMDPQHYPNPQVFDPDRFQDNNHKPSAKYLPFGDGPRMCIAMRFAVLEMKICVAKVLSEFTVTLSERTSQPLQFVPTAFFPRVEGGLFLRIQKRQVKVN